MTAVQTVRGGVSSLRGGCLALEGSYRSLGVRVRVPSLESRMGDKDPKPGSGMEARSRRYS